MVDLKPEQIAAYLHFGYVPRPDAELPFPAEWVPREKLEDDGRLVERGAGILRKAITGAVDPDRQAVVPLSGGLDSRALLAALVEAGFDVVAVTFGTPGTFDFEIGKLVAQRLGVKHEAIDLRAVRLSTDALVNVVRNGAARTSVLDAFYNRLMPEHLGESAVYIHGYLGGELSGAHAGLGSGSSWEQALEDFCRTQRRCRNISLPPPGYVGHDLLPTKPTVLALGHYEELDFRIRQTCFIRPIVQPKGFCYRFPFLDEGWVRFILGVPEELRRNQLYNTILVRAWPRAFSLPAKNACGIPITAPHWRRALAQTWFRAGEIIRRKLQWQMLGPRRKLNYIDLDQAIRQRKDFRQVIGENCADLEQRNLTPWLEINTIWKRHQEGRKNYGKALTLLAEVELNLKAEEGACTRGPSLGNTL